MPAHHLHVALPLERTPGFFRAFVFFLLGFLERCDFVEFLYPSHYSFHTFKDKIEGKKLFFHPLEDSSSLSSLQEAAS